MRNRIRRRMQPILGLVALLLVLGLLVVACGSGKANEGKTGKKAPAGGQQSRIGLPRYKNLARSNVSQIWFAGVRSKVLLGVILGGHTYSQGERLLLFGAESNIGEREASGWRA